LDTKLINISTDITDKFTDLNLYAYDLPAGAHKGSLTIDVCSDQTCSLRYGERYSIPYEISVLRYTPEFITASPTQTTGAISRNDILIDNFSGSDEAYQLTIVMPDTATDVIMPDDFINTYKVTKISATRFTMKPSISFASKTYSFTFTGPNSYLKSYDVNVWINHNPTTSTAGAAPLPYQVFAALSNPNSSEAVNTTYAGYRDKYYGNAELIPSISYITGANWVSLSPSPWSIGFNITPPAEYGIFEATVNLTYKDKTFSYPLVLANSKTYKQTWANERIEITPSSATNTASFVYIWDNCYIDVCNFDIPTTKPISNWIKNVKYSKTEEKNHVYSYEVDLQKIAEINPSLGAIPDGIITLSNSDGSDNYSLAKIPVELKIPNVAYVDVKKATENTPFEQTIYGSLYFFSGVEIVKLEKDSSGKYTQYGNTFFHSAPPPGTATESLTFTMPGLAKGFYKLNFSGIFSKHYPDFLLEVE
jgi:hypothetical protein